MSNFKVKYENSSNIKTDRVDTVLFNLHQIEQRNFLDTWYDTAKPAFKKQVVFEIRLASSLQRQDDKFLTRNFNNKNMVDIS